MPAFGAILDETARWNVIDFLNANRQARRLGQPDGLAAAPNFLLACPGGSTRSLASLRPRPVHLVLTDPRSQPRLHQLATAADAGGIVTSVVGLALAPHEDDGLFCRTQD